MKPAPTSMKWSNSIQLRRPVQGVRLLVPGSEQDAELRVRAAEQAAYERGRQDGEKALGEQLLQQRSDMLELQQGVLTALRQAVPQVIQQSQTALIQLALEAARRVVADMPVTPEIVEAVVREAVAQVGDTTEITIQLNPDDLALLHKHQSPLLKGLPETGPLKFLPCQEVTRGGCFIQTRFGLLDARRETKLEQLRESLTA